MRICVTTIYTENLLSIANITAFDNFKEYCDINGYDLKIINLDAKYEDLERPAAWYKVVEVKNLLSSGDYDWVFFIDVDCLFMTPTIKLESFIDDEHFLVIPANNDVFETPVRNKSGKDGVASCQFLIKNTDLSFEFLDDVWSANNIDTNLITHHDWEQRQFKYSVINPRFENGVKIVEEKLLNRYWYTNNVFLNFTYTGANKNIWEPGDFIVHIPGYHREERWRILKELNMLSGGMISKFEIEPNKIVFSPIMNLGETTIRLYNGETEISSYYFNKLNQKYSYFMFTDYIGELLVKTFDENNNLIGIKKLIKSW